MGSFVDIIVSQVNVSTDLLKVSQVNVSVDLLSSLFQSIKHTFKNLHKFTPCSNGEAAVRSHHQEVGGRRVNGWLSKRPTGGLELPGSVSVRAPFCILFFFIEFRL